MSTVRAPDKAFIALNTSAIPGELLESELFGHEKGSFTGADSPAPRPLRTGRWRHAVPRRNRRHDACRCRRACCACWPRASSIASADRRRSRWTCASSPPRTRTSRSACERGMFREDLFHRLNVIRIELPPLRSRARGRARPARRTTCGMAAEELGVETKTLAPVTLRAPAGAIAGRATCASW